MAEQEGHGDRPQRGRGKYKKRGGYHKANGEDGGRRRNRRNKKGAQSNEQAPFDYSQGGQSPVEQYRILERPPPPADPRQDVGDMLGGLSLNPQPMAPPDTRNMQMEQHLAQILGITQTAAPAPMRTASSGFDSDPWGSSPQQHAQPAPSSSTYSLFAGSVPMGVPDRNPPGPSHFPQERAPGQAPMPIGSPGRRGMQDWQQPAGQFTSSSWPNQHQQPPMQQPPQFRRPAPTVGYPGRQFNVVNPQQQQQQQHQIRQQAPQQVPFPGQAGFRAPMSPGRTSRQVQQPMAYGPGSPGARRASGGGRGRGRHMNQGQGNFRRRFERLDQQVLSFLAAVVPTDQEVANRKRMLSGLEDLIHSRWPEAHCEIYGSSASYYCLRGADVDACLVIDEKAEEDMEFSDDEDMEFEYQKAQRVKPGEGRHAKKQWEEKQERLKAEREARKAKREQKKADGEEGDTDNSDDEEDPQPGDENPDDADKEEDKEEKEERPENIGQQNIVVRLARMLKRAGMVDVLPLPRARVPIVKFRHPELNVLCDICINNMLALENTRLLCMYASLDERVVQLARFVKLWAKRRNINSAYRGTLSSYAYVILVIFYLQNRPVPLLPSLQQMRFPNSTPKIIDEHDCYFCSDMGILEHMGFSPRTNPNKESIGQLLAGFFKFYAHDFNFKDDVVSIRLGRYLTKAEKGWTTKHNTRRDRYWWCIEDPFEVSHNLGRVADRDSLYTMRGEFMRAHQKLYEGAELAVVCEKFTEDQSKQQGN